MAMLTRDQILSDKPLDTVEVDCPNLGGTIRLRPMLACERDAFEQRMVSMSQRASADPNVPLPNLRSFYLVHHIVDEHGELMFSVDDIDALGRQSARDIDKLFEVCQKLSSLTNDDVDALKKK